MRSVDERNKEWPKSIGEIIGSSNRNNFQKLSRQMFWFDESEQFAIHKRICGEKLSWRQRWKLETTDDFVPSSYIEWKESIKETYDGMTDGQLKALSSFLGNRANIHQRTVSWAETAATSSIAIFIEFVSKNEAELLNEFGNPQWLNGLLEMFGGASEIVRPALIVVVVYICIYVKRKSYYSRKETFLLEFQKIIDEMVKGRENEAKQ